MNHIKPARSHTIPRIRHVSTTHKTAHTSIAWEPSGPQCLTHAADTPFLTSGHASVFNSKKEFGIYACTCMRKRHVATT